MTKVALVTGASRGIGKATAVALAERGFYVAVTARTLQPGDPTALAPESGVMLPGSLSETEEAIQKAGQRSLGVRLDLLEQDTLAPSVDKVFDTWGRLDVLVNNAIYVGPGNTDLFINVDPEHIVKRICCNLTAQLIITQRALQIMSTPGEDGKPRGGRILNLSSQASHSRALRLSDDGASGLIYSTTKAGLNRLAPCLAQEHEGQGIEVLSVDPGVVITERVDAAGSRLRLVREMGGAPPEPVGKAMAYIADVGIEGADIEGDGIEGYDSKKHDPLKIIQAQDIARELGYL